MSTWNRLPEKSVHERDGPQDRPAPQSPPHRNREFPVNSPSEDIAALKRRVDRLERVLERSDIFLERQDDEDVLVCWLRPVAARQRQRQRNRVFRASLVLMATSAVIAGAAKIMFDGIGPVIGWLRALPF